MGWRQPAHPHQLGGLRERCKLPQPGYINLYTLPSAGPGRSPGRRRVFLYSEQSDCLSQHLSTCCIQFAWLGIGFFLGGIYISISPPHKYSWGCHIPCIPPLPTPMGVQPRSEARPGCKPHHLPDYWSMHSALGQDMALTCFDHLVPMWVTYGAHIDERYRFY